MNEEDVDDRLFVDVRVSSWEQAKSVLGMLRGYLFRGQGNSSWKLQPGLERAVQRWRVLTNDLPAVEAEILYEFRRRAHHYLNMPPAEGNDLEWLALIQHYGGPTRLLDFTHSPYIAAFFALENTETEAAIWAVDGRWLHARAKESFDLDVDPGPQCRERVIDVCQEIIRKHRGATGMLYVEPFRLNERMALQQGVFLFPCDVGLSFEKNLFGEDPTDEFEYPDVVDLPGSDGEQLLWIGYAPIVRVRLPEAIHGRALIDLASMNITAATLFGGLDGFARSLSLEGRKQWERRREPVDALEAFLRLANSTPFPMD